MITKVLVVAVFFAINCSLYEALECYKCLDYNGTCAKGGDNIKTVDCGKEDCIGFVITDDRINIGFRGCTKNNFDVCDYIHTCQYCTTNKCNDKELQGNQPYND